jgi:hypothetical protein
MTLYVALPRENWDSIRPGIEHILARYSQRFRVEDVYAALLHDSNTALVLNSDEPADVEFAVCRVYDDPVTRDRVLFIWLAYSKSGDAIARLMPDWQALAQKLGAGYIRWESDRNGYARVFKDEPGVRIYHEYEIPVHR